MADLVLSLPLSSLYNARYLVGMRRSCNGAYHWLTLRLAASITLYMWDYSLNVTEEMRVLWRRDTGKINRACLLWLRYAIMPCFLYTAYRTLTIFRPVDQSHWYCKSSAILALDRPLRYDLSGSSSTGVFTSVSSIS